MPEIMQLSLPDATRWNIPELADEVRERSDVLLAVAGFPEYAFA
jgi:hypothetical protein